MSSGLRSMACLFIPFMSKHTLNVGVYPSNKSQFTHHLQVLSEVVWVDSPPCLSGAAETLSFLLLTLVDWSSSHSVSHLMKMDLFCLDFRSAFCLSDFSLQCWLYLFSVCVPVIKEKATQPGPRQQAKVDTNVIETGYWYSKCWLPAHLARELFLLCILSMEVFLLIVGALFIHIVSL